MSIRANLRSSATRWPTIMVLITSGILLLLAVATFFAVPAIAVGEADVFVAWMPCVYGVTIAATVLATLVLQRRSSAKG
ncbi:hypothetical protein [Microbacterium sp. EST19A]|uniref:hypothetical protein n=1 Tax=Microbacterium sp. EST19A TaxID=2862681 RepID=UPI001CBD4411|nr:hypothetical protein [Microbacterium sp. EST19A]